MIYYLPSVLSVWFTSLGVINPGPIHVAANGHISFFFMAYYYFMMCVFHVCIWTTLKMKNIGWVNILSKCILSFLSISIWSRNYYYFHFTDAETEALKLRKFSKATKLALQDHAWTQPVWWENPWSSPPGCILSLSLFWILFLLPI